MRLLALDGMRGVAALCVVIYHRQDFFSDTHFFDWGWTNVDLFFLISGMVLSHVYERQIEAGAITFSAFLSHRVARLWPLHVFAMLMMLVVDSLHVALENGHVMDWHAPVYTFMLNLVFLQTVGLYHVGTGGGQTWDGNAWSLTPEIAANFAWFYLVMRKRLSSKLLVTVVLTFAVLQYNFAHSLDGLILGSSIVRCTISYALGCLLYRHFIANPALGPLSPRWGNVLGLGLVTLVALAVLDVVTFNSTLFAYWDWMLVLFVFPAFALCVMQPDTILNQIFSSRLAVFLGTISYSVYLLQEPIGLLLTGAIQYSFGTNFALARPYGAVLFLLLTISLSAGAYKYVETPARRALRNNLEPFLKKIVFDVN